MKLVRWRRIVERAKKNGHFTSRDRELVADWRTCAMGERYQFRRGSYDWLSDEEQRLSFEVSHAVEQDNFDIALALIEQIEALPE